MTGRRIRSARRGIDFDRARALLLGLPGVEEGPCYGTPGYRVRGKLLARIWPDLETLVVKCRDDERDVRMQLHPETYFLTDHYRGYPYVLVRLGKVPAEELREMLVAAWRQSAPRRLIAAFDAGAAVEPGTGRTAPSTKRRRTATISQTPSADARAKRRPARPRR